jgi:signal transduction histidine kinase/CheY-like chemotaxis protein
MNRTLSSIELRHPQDVVLARQRARHIARLLHFDAQDQTRFATAVSEIARNAVQYAAGGRVQFVLEGAAPQALLVHVSDRGPGIGELDAILAGRFQSATGMGLGLVGVRRIMDRFEIESAPGAGTTVVFGKALPKRAAPVGMAELGRLAEELVRQPSPGPHEEAREQTRDLLRTLDELRQQQAELASAHEELQRRERLLSQLNQELEDTNRGVVALYAELEEKADFLGRASEMKSRFLSNMSHEFRTPLNAVTGLTRLLLDRTDGELTAEQAKQVMLIRRAAESLTELVNDLLDLAKVEAGKVAVRAADFDVGALFGGLRGMLRPLLSANSSVELIFDEPAGLPLLHTDESKVSQILRNFISNALKFTERGEVRVRATTGPGDSIVFSVADTGIGIAPEDQARIFEEFSQIDGPHQRKAKGTGLGLPLVRKLAGLLGGHVELRSQPGVGSTFSAVLPRAYPGPAEVVVVPEVSAQLDPSRRPVLVVEDNREALFIYEKYLKGTGFQVIPAQTLRAARHALGRFHPAAIVLDVLLDRESGWELLAELKQSPHTRDIPVLVVTLVENQAKAMALGAHAYCTKPVERGWLLAKLRALAGLDAPAMVLLIDDDDASRYLVKESLADSRCAIVEADSGAEGLRRALAQPPRLVILDLELPDCSGLDVLKALRDCAETRQTPVIINTAKVLADADREVLRAAGATAILSKECFSRKDGLQQVHEVLRHAGLES